MCIKYIVELRLSGPPLSRTSIIRLGNFLMSVSLDCACAINSCYHGHRLVYAEAYVYYKFALQLILSRHGINSMIQHIQLSACLLNQSVLIIEYHT